MRFSIVSHACMYVEGEGGSVLFDPWMIGTCYWRSWANFPEPPRELVDSLNPTAIYITHLHWDHFHGPSLKRFDSNIRIYVPKTPTRRMVEDLHQMGYPNVVEIPHGDSVEVWPGARLHSYQFGPVFADSAAVVTDGETTLLNLNDAKTFGLSLGQILKKFPDIDFVFRSHSSATPIPACVEGHEQHFTDLRTTKDYIDEFSNCCLLTGARYAIPFASNHCFVHKDTVRFNDRSVNPAMVAEGFADRAAQVGADTECVIMAPGSSWDSRTGFDIRPFDYGDKDRYVAEIRQKYERTLVKQYEREDRTRGNFKAFEIYFSRLMKAMPGVLRKRTPATLFEVTEKRGTRYFFADFAHQRIEERQPAPEEIGLTITIHPLVLNDCCKKKMFSAWSPGKRLKFTLPDGVDHLGPVNNFLTLVDFYENDGLPLSRNLSPRQVGVRMRRWREGAEAVRLFANHKLLRRKMVIADLYRVPPRPVSRSAEA